MYLASSVVNALKEDKSLSITGLEMVTCPTESCVISPEECSKGQAQTCAKKIDIVYEHNGHKKLAVLIFRYQVSNHAREGFIRKEDLALRKLLKREIISRENLTEI